MQLTTVLGLITCGVQESGNRACGLLNLDEGLACSPCTSPAGNTSNSGSRTASIAREPSYNEGKLLAPIPGMRTKRLSHDRSEVLSFGVGITKTSYCLVKRGETLDYCEVGGDNLTSYL